MNDASAAIITIGDELLIGQVIDTNSAWIAQQLNAIGIHIVSRIAVGDDNDAICAALDNNVGKHRIVIITGGLGPTADDITKPLLCQYFGGKLIRNQTILDHVTELFARRNKTLTERNAKQADVPDVCTVLYNKMGTAPGMWFEKNGTSVISLPGVPFEMAHIMEHEVLPRLKTGFSDKIIVHKAIITAGEGESALADKIIDVENRLPSHIKLAYLPSLGMVRLRLTGTGSDKDILEQELETFVQAIAQKISEHVVSFYDWPMEKILGELLVTKNLTLGLAESCTGGNIGHKITQIPGSSRYFMGGIVCYNETVKESILNVPSALIEEKGVVSEEVAVAMAVGARSALKTDIGFGVTGYLSESEGYLVPVGTVCMGFADKDRVITKTFKFHYDRDRNKEQAVNTALLQIWKFIKREMQ